MIANTEISMETLKKIALANRANPYVDITAWELQIGLPIVNYSGFFCQEDERLVYVAPAKTFKDTNQFVGYSGTSGGASFRVAKGVTIRSGRSGGRAIRQDIRKFNDGDLIITNKRVLFIGKDDSFEFKVDKISTTKVIAVDCFIIQSGRNAKNIQIDSNIATYALGLINYVIQNYGTVNSTAEFYDANKQLTQEQMEYCNNVRLQSLQIKLPKTSSKKNTGLWKIAKILLCIAALLFALLIILNIAFPSAKNQSKELTITDLSQEEIVTLKNHPRLYDSYSEATAFYENIGDKRVLISQGSDKTLYEWHDESNDENPVVLFINPRENYEDYIGGFTIKLRNSTSPVDLSIEEFTAVVKTYLPEYLLDYYDIEDSYSTIRDNFSEYTCAFTLNDAGKKYKETSAPYLRDDFCIQLSHNNSFDGWLAETKVGYTEMEKIEGAEYWDAESLLR
ncbi:hypothetical protein CSX00_06110 [Pseudobutyrivibrio ruminis]|uniref:Uncharacterized protein n=1 Tax=Pseudobutyrivibrio ruminis TaxID=46206 RepID=A0A2G3EAX4_9FIRM|nr:hypothetical protein [Pseudobutyrivibrio ruminis]PHU40459.1 hypothetical protein CSX00_06110 [Pseudobutyrivibrio ruminis]